MTTTLPKLIHAERWSVRGVANRGAMCGRLVSLFGIGKPEEVTCPRCRAKLDQEAAEALLASLTTQES